VTFSYTYEDYVRIMTNKYIDVCIDIYICICMHTCIHIVVVGRSFVYVYVCV